jgi:hypothetical protein
MYWIDLLIYASAIPLIGWLGYGFVDSIQHNDTRGLVVWGGVVTFTVAILAALLVAGAISI